MNEYSGMTLPYRTSGEELVKLVRARARGRTLEQARSLGFSRKSFEGTLSAAEAFRLVNGDGELMPQGERLALADGVDEHAEVLREAFVQFEPYDLLLEALGEKGLDETETEWIETWWSTQGFGSSESNRREASSTFARLADYAGLGKYIQGRRGHASRIEWNLDRLLPPAAQQELSAAHSDGGRPSEKAGRGTTPPPVSAGDSSRISLSIPTKGGGVIEIHTPPTLLKAEREGLINTLTTLIRIRGGEDEATDD